MGLDISDREYMDSSFSGTLDEVRVNLLRSTAAASVLGDAVYSWTTSTSFYCNLQPIEAFRRIQEGLAVGPGGLTIASTHRAYLPLGENVFEGDRLEQASGSAAALEQFNVRNIREYSGSHIEVDLLKVRP